MLIDIRTGVPMGVPQGEAAVSAPQSRPGEELPRRELLVHGEPAFQLTFWCGTCSALCRKLTAPQQIDLGLANDRLGTGLDVIDDEILRAYAAVLPQSTYTVLLLEVTPCLVHPGEDADYFTHEQVTTWGVVHYPHPDDISDVSYYRTFEAPVSPTQHLYEFVVPMIPPTWNDRARVDAYAAKDGISTVVAYSIVEVLTPAMDYGDDYYGHVVVTHFLLDGHHKLEAATATQRPIRMLALIDERASLASSEDLASMIQARAGTRQAR